MTAVTPEHETRGFLIARGARRRVLGRFERGFDQLGRREAARLAALQVGCRYHIETGVGGELRQRGAGLELAEHVVGLGLQALGDLVVAPARFDLVLHLVERALARRRDAGDVEPEIAAVRQLQRIVVDPDVAGKRCGDHVRGLRQVGDRFAVRAAAGAVDRFDDARVEAEFLGGLGERGAGRALVLELVAQIAELGLGAAPRRSRV